MPDDSGMRCLQCQGDLEPSGQEPYRHICVKCGQNYLIVVQMVPVEPLRLPALEAKCSTR